MQFDENESTIFTFFLTSGEQQPRFGLKLDTRSTGLQFLWCSPTCIAFISTGMMAPKTAALWLNKSREDLAKVPGGPRDGLMVTIYMIGEIEMEATLEWDAERQAWTARPITETIRDNHETWDS
jgi:hypothetical protein